jgi:hypothetical protein
MEGKPFPFGAKTIEELEARDASKNPDNNNNGGEGDEVKKSEGEEVKGEEGKDKGGENEPAKFIENKSSWIEDINKKYKSEFKSEDDFEAFFNKAKKVDEYEPKLSEYVNKEKEYEKQLAELQSSLKDAYDPLKFFASPEAYVAEQLRMQHPDKSPSVLQDVVMADNKLMDDISVLIKNKLLNNPDLIGGEQGAKDIVLDEFGIDPETPKAEWSVIQQNKIKVAAREARKQWDLLKENVKIPKRLTAEEREAERTAERDKVLNERKTKLDPLKADFSKFDKFIEKIDDDTTFEFIVPKEYQEELPGMFETFMVDSEMEVNQDNLDSLKEIKEALLLRKHFKQIYKTIEADVQTKEKAKRDELLGNHEPANTHKALEQGESDSQKFSNEYGLGKMFGKKK